MCVRGYIDLGTYFMSVVHEVQWKVEEWAGVPPDVTTVMRALREGLVGCGCAACALSRLGMRHALRAAPPARV